MTNPVAQIHTETFYGKDEVIGKSLWLWCPGCDLAHRMMIEKGPDYDEQPVWTWNQSLETPGVEPSVLVTWTITNDPEPYQRCHSFLRNGIWEFLPDSTHHLSGQSVPVVPLPDWLVRPREN